VPESSQLPARPSLEQLKKQAKERRRTMPGVTLAEAQLTLARQYGFESWPRLVHHVKAIAAPEVAQHDRMAHDMVAAYRNRDDAAAARLNELFHSAITVDQIRHFIEDRLVNRPGGTALLASFDIRAARLLVSGLFGFESWEDFLNATTAAAGTGTGSGLSSKPPFHRVDEATRVLSIQQPMSAHDWDIVVGIIRERGLTGLDANHMIDDAAMPKLAAVEHLTLLKLHGCDRLTDDGLRHLAKLRGLEAIEIGGWNSPMTDAGFAALTGLPRLRTVGSWWSQRITDGGVGRTLAACDALEDVSFGGTTVGDATIAALAGKPALRRIFAGKRVSDVGLSSLTRIPRFVRWHGGEPSYSLMEFDAGPTYVGVEGPMTAEGLRALHELDGVFALNLQWQAATMNSSALGLLASLARLGFLALNGDRCDDEAMRQVGRLPHLRMLLAQGPVAGDAGFEALSASRSLEYYWGRECPNLGGRGFSALASMPSLKGLAVSCKSVDDASLAALPSFPALRELMPMDVADDGFRHVGRCERLEHLWCMYCRETGDRATEHISGLRLRSYYAGLTKITDRSLELLSRMTSLERINLHHCQGISDRGVRALAALPALRELTIEGSRTVTRPRCASGTQPYERHARLAGADGGDADAGPLHRAGLDLRAQVRRDPPARVQAGQRGAAVLAQPAAAEHSRRRCRDRGAAGS
jgi:hypothetical protein